MRDGCCICFKTNWTLTINNLKCESYSWTSNFLKGICFGVHFHYVVIETKLSWKARSMREPALFRWHFGGLPFMGNVCKSLRPGNHPFFKKKTTTKKLSLFSSLDLGINSCFTTLIDIFFFPLNQLNNSIILILIFLIGPDVGFALCNWPILLWMQASVECTMITNYWKWESYK